METSDRHYHAGDTARKILATLCSIAVILCYYFAAFATGADCAGEIQANRYYYSQLGEDGQAIYDALVELYGSGGFLNGEEQGVQGNAAMRKLLRRSSEEEQQELHDAFNAAVHAFSYDNPSVFYIDWTRVHLQASFPAHDAPYARIVPDPEAHSYLAEGFSDGQAQEAEQAFQGKVQEALASVPAIPKAGMSLRATQAAYLHDWLAKHMVYHNTEEADHAGCSAHTAYDALIYEEGVCESYAKAYKVLCDSLGLPAICVLGDYSANGTNEAHMWNYVQLEDGSWEGVDVTLDDPAAGQSSARDSGIETSYYILRGKDSMARDHATDPVLQYPELGTDILPIQTEAQEADDSLAAAPAAIRLAELVNLGAAAAVASGTVALALSWLKREPAQEHI